MRVSEGVPRFPQLMLLVLMASLIGIAATSSPEGDYYEVEEESSSRYWDDDDNYISSRKGSWFGGSSPDPVPEVVEITEATTTTDAKLPAIKTASSASTAPELDLLAKTAVDKNPHNDMHKLLRLADTKTTTFVMDSLVLAFLACLMVGGAVLKLVDWDILEDRNDKGITYGEHSSIPTALSRRAHHAAAVSYEAFDAPDLQRLLEQHATSDHVALEFADGTTPSVTFRQLHTEAAGIASCLTHNGVGKGHVAAIIMKRGKTPLAAMLGVIKSEATFLNLEPKYPLERIEVLLSDSGSSAILVQDGLADCVPPSFQGLVISISPELHSNMTLQANLLNVTETVVDTADPPVFLQYTSGSSGKPKAVLMGNHPLVARLHGMQSEWPTEPGDKWLMKASTTFGVFEFETFLPLAFGTTIVVLPPGHEVDPYKINDTIIKKNVSHATFITPQLMQCLNTSGEHSLHQAKSLKHVVQCGAPLSWSCVHEFVASTPHQATLWNAYGASESSITCWKAPREARAITALEEKGSVPLGKAIPLCQVFLLKVDSTDEIQTEEPGEICFTGAIASGYKGRPEDTAKSFIKNPFGEGMMYRTGDMGFVKNGLLFTKGRADRQVKVQGKRLELDEVENAVAETADSKGLKVDEVVAVVVKNGDDNAVHVFVTGAGVPTDEIRQEMKRHVPAHVVPAHMTAVQELPRLASGKADIPALTRLAEEQGSDEASISVDLGSFASLSDFMDSEEGRRLQDQGVDSLGMAKLFRQSDDEVKTVDNMYALAMMMIIFFHMAGGFIQKDSTQYVYVPFVTPDSMTVWCMIAGYQEGARSAAMGPDRPVRFHNGDFVVFLVWVVMRFVIPAIMMPLWSVLAPSGAYPIAATQGWGNAWSTQYGWQDNQFNACPWDPAWFLKWLLIAKVHAVMLSCLRVPAAAQIVLLMALGNLDFFWQGPGTPPSGGWNELQIPTAGLYGEWAFSLVGENLFWNMGEMVDTAWYVGGIYYAQTAMAYGMKLGKSGRNAAISVFAIVALFVTANFVFTPTGFPASDSGWEDGRSVLARSVDDLGTWGSYMHWAKECDPDQATGCVVEHFYKYWGPYTVFCLLFWPLIVWLKIVAIQKLPFHMASIGKTTLGAFMIHVYCPYIQGMSAWHDTLGEWGAALAIVSVSVAYAFFIQYTVGRLTHHLTMLALAPGVELSIRLWDKAWETVWTFCHDVPAHDGVSDSEKTPLLNRSNKPPATPEGSGESTASDSGHSSSMDDDSSSSIDKSASSGGPPSNGGSEGDKPKRPDFKGYDQVTDEQRHELTKVCDMTGVRFFSPNKKAPCKPPPLADLAQTSIFDQMKPRQFDGLPTQAASHSWYKWLLPVGLLTTPLMAAFGAQVLLPFFGEIAAEMAALLIFAPDQLAQGCNRALPGAATAHCTAGCWIGFIVFWAALLVMAVMRMTRLGIYCYRLWLGIQPINEHVHTGVHHCLVVCEYKEPLEVLQMTLRSVRDQKGHVPASEIEVVLACEFKDPERDETFNRLTEEFMPVGGPMVFKRFIQTVHRLDDEGVEVAGKSSNENHAIRELYAMKTAEGVSPSKVLVTIADADSLFAPEYYAQLDHTWACYPSPELLMYDGPLNTYRNYFEIEFFIQAFESMRCTSQTTSVWKQWDGSGPIETVLSNYSLSLHLAEKIGFWDPTNTPEDLHTSLKAYMYTHGSITVAPVFSVISNDSVSGFGDRYTQAKRHAWGITEVAWMLVQAKRLPFNIYYTVAPLIMAEQLTDHCKFAGLLMFAFPGMWDFLSSISTPALIAVFLLPALAHLGEWVNHLAVETLMWTTILPNNPEFPRTTRWQWVLLVVHMAVWPVICFPAIIFFETIPRIDAMIHAFRSTHLAYVTAPKAINNNANTPPRGDQPVVPVVVN